METMQQPKITGYRQLSESEALLMNQIKAHGADLELLINAVLTYLNDQEDKAPQRDAEARAKSIAETGMEGPDSPEQHRLWAAQPKRWAAIARTHFQEGLMALTRAVAQPGSF